MAEIAKKWARSCHFTFFKAGYYKYDFKDILQELEKCGGDFRQMVQLDPGKSCIPGSPQYNWLKIDLESTSNTRKLVRLGNTDYAGSGTKGAKTQQYIQRPCEAYGVDICFMGQDTGYAQTESRGVKYIPIRSVPTGKTAANRSHHLSASGALHYCIITVDGDILTFQTLGLDGEKLDSLTMKDFRGAGK